MRYFLTKYKKNRKIHRRRKQTLALILTLALSLTSLLANQESFAKKTDEKAKSENTETKEATAPSSPPKNDKQHLTAEEQHNIHVYESASPAIVHIAISGTDKEYYWGLIPFEATGSGVIISKDGYILTNNHVIEGADKITVTLLDGNIFTGKLIGTGDEHDVALIKIEATENDEKNKEAFPTIQLGDSEQLVVGQKVFALGGPFGLKSSFSSGVISSLNRRIGSGIINNMIQTDAAINPGNSGGALLNTEGKLIGINTAIYSPSGASAGIGFAIPVNTAKRIIGDLKKYGHVIRPWLGVQVETELQPQLAKQFRISSPRGLLIKRIKEDSPAHKAGLRGGTHKKEKDNGEKITLGGDIIISVDDRPANNAVKFIDYIESKRVGEIIKLMYMRNGITRTINIKLDEKERKKPE